MAEKKEALPGFVAPFVVREHAGGQLWMVCDSTRSGCRTLADCLGEDEAQSLARVLNSHAQCVEALKRVSTFSTTWDGSTSSAIGEMESIARSALKLAEGVEHG